MNDGTNGFEDMQLEVRDLEVHYDGIRALHGVSFTVLKGETLERGLKPATHKLRWGCNRL